MTGEQSSGSGRTSDARMSSNGQRRKEVGDARATEPQTKAEETAQRGPGMRGRNPSDEPDVFVDAPKVHVGEIYFDVDRLDAHLSLQASVANLVQITAGVHVHVNKVELDIKDVDAEARLKVRLENLYDILDRTLTTLDRNPEIVSSALNTVGTAAGDIGQTAQQALGPGGAVGQAANTVGKVGQQAVGPGGVASQAAQGVGNAAGQATQDVGDAAGQTAQSVAQGTQGVAQDAQGARQDAENVDPSDGESRKRSPNAAEKRGTKIGTAAARSPKRSSSGKSSSGRGASGTAKRAPASEKTTATERGSK